MLKAVKEEQQQNNKRRGGSLRLMYYYTCPLVGFFSPKNSRQNPIIISFLNK
ncbi:MAG TPA: hypothetical protein VFP49_12890 [Nitrososphaeraceae archaeon]|nr:hypothetical protein [Nitrososphaeraceae archaeon]